MSSRVHGTGPGGEWALDIQYERPGYSAGLSYSWAYALPRCELSLTLTAEQAQRLLDSGDRRWGAVSFSASLAWSGLRASGIEVTPAEAQQIARTNDPWRVLGLAGGTAKIRYTLVPAPPDGTGE